MKKILFGLTAVAGLFGTSAAMAGPPCHTHYVRECRPVCRPVVCEPRVICERPVCEPVYVRPVRCEPVYVRPACHVEVRYSHSHGHCR